MESRRFFLPRSLRNCIEQDLLVGVIQFGSSLTKQQPNDIDLAVVVRRGRFTDFLIQIHPEDFRSIDISLIREEELSDLEHFRFGSHGVHLVPVFASGRVLHGVNPFRGIEIPVDAVLRSILLRLFDYMYEVRKSHFRDTLPMGMSGRWAKFSRLSLLFLTDDLHFPDVLNISDQEVVMRWQMQDIHLEEFDLPGSYEAIWEKVLSAERTKQYLSSL